MNIVKIFLKSFVPNINVAYLDYKSSRINIPFKNRIGDLLSVLGNTGFFLLFIFLAIFLLILVSPGRDALLLVIEDVNNYNFSSLISLLIGLFTWSIVSEFGVRYSIYVTDNSGKSLSAERVEWRKFVQKLVAGCCLMIPSVIVIISLAIMAITDPSIKNNKMWVSFALTLLLVYWLLSILTNLYFHSYKAYKKGLMVKRWFLASTRLSPREVYWTSKIFGIYNDYVFILPKPANYLADEKKNFKIFTDYFEDTPPEERDQFPQNKTLLASGVVVPEEFEFTKFEDGGPDKSESLRWIYYIPLRFYTVLHKQVIWVFLSALTLLLTISFLPAERGIFEFLGSPGLLCGSLACWIGIYVGVLYADYALLRKSWFSLRLFLFALLLFSSYFNNDHPVRAYHSKKTERMAFRNHFEAWFTNYKKHFADQSDTAKYPVVFICAEGGAFRTGAYTAMFLESLQKKLARQHIDFKSSVYAMSGVSGGSLGLGFYNSETYINKPSDFIKSGPASPAELFFGHDCLSPIMGKMLYGDLLNLWIPFHISRFDRAIALESAWEDAFNQLLKPGKSATANTFKNNFLASYRPNTKAPLPLLLLNTTEAETGYQCWITNVIPGHITYGDQRDLLGFKLRDTGFNYSTAINFSSRFPLFSPGAMVRVHDLAHNHDTTYKRHYVDGGYYENTGAGSMYELLNQVRRDPMSKQLYPVMIYLRFSETPANEAGSINFGNEIMEILAGIYDARSARSHMAIQQLNGLVSYFNSAGDYTKTTGTWIDEPLKENLRQVPVNWVLSTQSMDNLKKAVAQQLEYNGGILHKIVNCQYQFPKTGRK